MSYKLYKVNNISEKKREREIEEVFSLNWRDNISNPFISFDFSTTETLDCGTWIELFCPHTQKSVFCAMITKIEQKRERKFKEYKYSGYDYGLYLEKNETTIQFRDQSIKEAIIATCAKANLNVGSIPAIEATVKNIYVKKSLLEILQDLYKTALDKDKEFKDEFYFSCKDGKINLLPYEKNNNLKGYIADIYSIDSIKHTENYTITTSIENLKNRVEIYKPITNNKLDDDKPIISKENIKSIEKYGLLSQVEEIDLDAKANFDEIAEKKLNELCVAESTLKLNLIADYNTHCGVITEIKNDKLGIQGDYLIISSKHNIEGTCEKVETNFKCL